MSNVTPIKLAGLPADFVNKLSTGIAESRASTTIAGGKPLMRLLKDGAWVYGVENIDVEEGSTWAVNVMSLAHGYSCWVDVGGKNELQGEVMISMAEPKPQRPPPIGQTPYAEQRSFELKCISGEDNGVETLYKTASVGGMRAVDELLADIQAQLRDNPAYPCPVLRLESDSYDHKKWGRTYVPIFDIVGWVDMNGNPAGARARVQAEALPNNPAAIAQATETPPPAPAPARTRRQATPAAVEQPAPAPAPAPAAPVHTGQRRRPAR